MLDDFSCIRLLALPLKSGIIETTKNAYVRLLAGLSEINVKLQMFTKQNLSRLFYNSM